MDLIVVWIELTLRKISFQYIGPQAAHSEEVLVFRREKLPQHKMSV